MPHSTSAATGLPGGQSRLVRFLSGARADLRHGFRLLWKSRGFTAVTLLTLALCIGANTAIFSAVYGLMLRPLPFPEPDRLVQIYNTYPKAGGNASRGSSNIVQYLDYGQNAHSYQHVGLWNVGPVMFGEDSAAERLWGAQATADFFDVLGLEPMLGAFFTRENQAPAADKVIVLAQSFWETHFQADPAILGRTVRIDGETYTVLGVAPRLLETFNARVRYVRPMAWDPARVNPAARHGNNPQLYARLKAGVSVAQAQAEAEVIERRFYDAGAPAVRQFLDRSGHQIVVREVTLDRIAPWKTTLLLLQGGVVLVLLIGCVNVANLLLARANGRRAELAIRAALGATRGAIGRQLVLESMLLTALGTAAGIGVGWAAIYAMNLYRARLMPDALPFALDGGVLGFTIAVAIGVALLISTLPLIYVLRANLIAVMQGSSRGASGAKVVRVASGALIVGQVAFALMLLVGAGLLIHAFIRAISVEPGFEPRGVITARINVPLAHRRADDAARSLQDRVLQAMREIPGVQHAALSGSVPFQGGLPVNALTLAEETLPPGAPQPGANRVTVTADYLATLRLTLLEGRFLEPGDFAPNQRVFVVDEEFAKRYFPGRSAVGGRFTFGNRPANDAEWPTIIGVVRNVPHRGVEERKELPYVYQALAGRAGTLALFLRTERGAADTLAQLREKLRAIDPAIALYETGPLETFVEQSFTQRRSVMLLLAAFATLALFLSALGIYGVLAYDVAQRTREIGVRGAIGATPETIVRLIMRQGLWKAVLGLAIGLIGSFVATRYMKTLLFDVSPTDLRAYACVSALLLVIAALASYLPARRAARINPIEALRVE